MKNKNIAKTGTIGKRIIKNSFWSLSSSMISKIGALIFTIILARFLMPQGYGLYSIVLSVAIIFTTFTDLGIARAFIRYASSAIAEDKNKLSAYYYYLLKIKLFLTITLSVLLLLLAYPLSKYVFNSPELFLPLLISAFYVLVLSFEGFYTSIYYAIEKIEYISLKESFGQVLRIVFALFVVHYVVSSYQIIGIFVALTISTLFLLIFNLYWTRKLYPRMFKKTKAQIDKKRVGKFVGYSIVASVSGVFFSYIDSIILGIFLLPEFVGYYRAASSLVFGITGILTFPNLVLLSVLTKLEGKRVKNVFNKMFRYISMLTIPAIFGILVLGPYFIKLLYGPHYMPSVLPLYFLSILIFLTVIVGSFLSLFSAEERPEIFAKLILITSIINVILNIVLIKFFLSFASPEWATAGAAIATSASWIFYFVASIHYTRKELRFSIPIRSLIKPLIASIVMFFGVYYLTLTLTDINLPIGIFLVVEGVIVYVVTMLLIKGIEKEDFDLLKKIIKRE